MKPHYLRRAALAALMTTAGFALFASSHREAPLITSTPKLDGADFYIFNSYEAGRSNYVTLVANYLPLQDAYGGPNYFTLDTNGLYEIHIDNNGDAVEDLTFQFRFASTSEDIALVIGPAGNTRTNAIPLIIAGTVSASNSASLNVQETYSINLIRGNRRTGTSTPITNAVTNSKIFNKPVDNIGNKTIADYNSYANTFIADIRIPGSTNLGRVFIGQRKDPFVVNLGETFDLINISTSPLGPVDANKDSLHYKNITSIILEIPKDALLTGTNTIIGAWTTASKVDGTNITQVSRLGMPLVNEVVIGLRDKDKFNASEPKDDGQFVDYITHPILPAFIELLYGSAGVKAPTLFPRTDLVQVFATGLPSLNANGSTAEMIRLNTAIAAVPAAQQKNLGAIAGDASGFPNGRRPGDDVVDIALRVVMGALLHPADAPSGTLPFTDGAYVDAKMFNTVFPYLNPPLAGSPNDPYVQVTVHAASAVTGQFSPVAATYDPVKKELSAPKPAQDKGFYRLDADGNVSLDSIRIEGGNAKLGIH